jgi:uncharacterized phage infection (PIP) family protein YhgE
MIRPLVFGFSPIPERVMHSDAFMVLMTFVAINTVAYAALSVAKLLPAVHPGQWFTSRNRRRANRSIYPDDEV